LAQVNSVRIRNGMPVIDRRSGYLPHFMRDVIQHAHGDLAAKLDPNAKLEHSDLDPNIINELNERGRVRDRSGAPATTPAGMDPFFQYARELGADQLRGRMSTADILEQYVRSAARVIAWTDALPIIRDEMARLNEAKRPVA